MQPSFLPDPAQLSRMMSEAMAPAFVLGAVAGFVSILLGRLTAVVDRIRILNDVAEDDRTRVHLKADLPRLRRRAELLSNAAHLAILSGMCVGLLLIAGFVCAYLRLEHLYGAAPLFVVGVALLVAALFRFSQEVRIGLRPIIIAKLWLAAAATCRWCSCAGATRGATAGASPRW